MEKKVWDGKIEKNDFIQLQESSARVMGMKKEADDNLKNELYQYDMGEYSPSGEDEQDRDFVNSIIKYAKFVLFNKKTVDLYIVGIKANLLKFANEATPLYIDKKDSMEIYLDNISKFNNIKRGFEKIDLDFDALYNSIVKPYI